MTQLFFSHPIIKACFVALIFSCFILPVKPLQAQMEAEAAVTYHTRKREMRGVWITTVFGSDFPKHIGTNSYAQKEQMRQLIDSLAAAGINSVFFQVRPSGDAFYQTHLAPWSEWLTGVQGRAPEPFYDPLALLIEHCHLHGIEAHAWLNPYRATHNIEKTQPHDSHLLKSRPDWILTYGKKRILNPGLPQVRQHIVEVVKDLIIRYDLDGIHFDDYFYPYPEKDLSINDLNTYVQYNERQLALDDWRRDNVDKLIRDVSETIQKYKPLVKFGVSPPGVWRNQQDDPRGSATRAGIPAYDAIFANSLRWLEEGWIDYIAPQLYWHIGHPTADFQTLIDWWAAQKNSGRHIYIGHALYKGVENSWNNRREIIHQIEAIRKLPNIQGSIHFRAAHLFAANSEYPIQVRQAYRSPILLPNMPWKDSIPPLSPRRLMVAQDTSGVLLRWLEPYPAADQDEAQAYVIYRCLSSEVLQIENPRHILSVKHRTTDFFDQTGTVGASYVYGVSALDKMHNESSVTKVRVSRYGDRSEDTSLIIYLRLP
jgi:uncharacterized lipoprotein YddW (UPF0748 family)